MKYQVIRTCYFNNRLFTKGEIVTLEGSVPEHFLPLPSEEKPATTKRRKTVNAQRG